MEHSLEAALSARDFGRYPSGCIETIVNAPVSKGQVYHIMGTRQPQIGYVNHILFKLQLLRPRNDILQRLLMPLPLHKRQHRQRLSIRHRRDPDIPVKVEIGTHRRAE